MPFSFVQPAYLGLLVLLLPLWALALADRRRIATWRRWLSIGLRTAVLLALVFALAGAQLVWPADRMTTVFVIDNSDSVSPLARAEADEFVQAALARMPAGDQAAIVVFGGEAIVERPPSATTQYIRSTVLPPSDQTDVGRALELALAVLPGETRKRVVLLSDGAETRGRALDAAAVARAADVPIETVALVAPPAAEDVALEALEAPATAREGQQLRITVQARTGRAATARLQLLLDRQPILETDVQLQPGLNRIPVTVPAPGPGFHAWEARITAPADTVGANNVQFGFSEVRGEPRVLLVEGAPGRAANLQAALDAARLNPHVVAPRELPASLVGMDAYDVVVLVDVPYRSLPPRAAELLPAYVRELGRGLLMVGGEDSYAAGGYFETPVEAALPVEMRTHGLKIQPDVAIVLLIDQSGSMDGAKLELAKEGAAQTFATLAERDQIGVIAFDTSATWAVDLQRKPPAEAFLADLGSIGGGGGTDLRPGLEAATSALERAEAKVKHVVLLSDGQADHNYDDVVERMARSGITLSAVGIDDFDPYLKQITARANGRFYPVANFNDVPRLFFDESLRVARRGIVEQEFTPLVGVPSPAVRELRGVPPLYGYNAVTAKSTAQVVLLSPDDDPILAQWQFGLGRAVAWTSDMKGQWAREWVEWDGFGRFAAQLVTDLLPVPSPEGFEASAAIEGTALVLELRADELGGRARSGLGAVGRVIGADGSVQELPLVEVEPGRYRGTTALPTAGVYRAQVLVRGSDGASLGVVTMGAVVPPSAEYLQRDGNVALLSRLSELTGGRSGIAPAQVWDAPPAATRRSQPVTWPLLWLAVLLWPVDIALRRLFPATGTAVRRSVLASAWRRRAAPAASLDLARRRLRARVQAAPGDPVPPSGTSGAGTTSSEGAGSAQFDWRRTRRSVVERPGKSEGGGR